MNLKELHPWMHDMGEHGYKAPAATMPYATHFTEQNALTDNKQT